MIWLVYCIRYTVACIAYRNCIHQSTEAGTGGQTHTKKGGERERWYDTEWAEAGCCWMGWEMGRLDNDPSTSRWSVSFSTSVSVQSSSCTLFFILMVVDAVVWRVSGKKLSRTANPASATKILHFQIFLSFTTLLAGTKGYKIPKKTCSTAPYCRLRYFVLGHGGWSNWIKPRQKERAMMSM